MYTHFLLKHLSEMKGTFMHNKLILFAPGKNKGLK